MLSKASALAVLAASSLVSAQQFLTTPDNFELYPAPILGQEAVNSGNTTTVLRDLQFKCQYMAGLNFYDLQNLNQ
jgi:hypothetical protein